MEEKTQSNEGKVGAPEGNKNAEKYDFDTCKKTLEKALELSASEKYDFIGEIAKDMGTTNNRLNEHVRKYPALKPIYDDIKSNCETNCFRNGKNGGINTSMAIFNLKANHNWKDRIDTTSGDKPIEPSKTTVVNYGDLSDEFIEELAKKSANWRE